MNSKQNKALEFTRQRLIIDHFNRERFFKKEQLATIEQKPIFSIPVDEIEHPLYKHLYKFMFHLYQEIETDNPYNDHSLFEKVTVLHEDIVFSQDLRGDLGRHRLHGGNDLEVRRRFEVTMPVTDYDLTQPILLDKSGLIILDGWERYITSYRIGLDVKIKHLNISDAQAARLYNKQNKKRKP